MARLFQRIKPTLAVESVQPESTDEVDTSEFKTITYTGNGSSNGEPDAAQPDEVDPIPASGEDKVQESKEAPLVLGNKRVVLPSIDVWPYTRERLNDDKSVAGYDIFMFGTVWAESKDLEMVNHVVTLLSSLTPEQDVNVYLDTGGGCVEHGDVIASALRKTKAKTVAHAIGDVMSMGTVLFDACQEHVVAPFSVFMYHQLAGGVSGRLKDMQLKHGSLNKLQAHLFKGMVGKYITEEEYADVVNGRDVFIPGSVIRNRLTTPPEPIESEADVNMAAESYTLDEELSLEGINGNPSAFTTSGSDEPETETEFSVLQRDGVYHVLVDKYTVYFGEYGRGPSLRAWLLDLKPEDKVVLTIFGSDLHGEISYLSKDHTRFGCMVTFVSFLEQCRANITLKIASEATLAILLTACVADKIDYLIDMDIGVPSLDAQYGHVSYSTTMKTVVKEALKLGVTKGILTEELVEQILNSKDRELITIPRSITSD